MKKHALNRAEITNRLTTLDHSMDCLKKKHPVDARFWPAFATQVGVITYGANAADHGWALQEIEAILVKHGEEHSRLRALQLTLPFYADHTGGMSPDGRPSQTLAQAAKKTPSV